MACSLSASLLARLVCCTLCPGRFPPSCATTPTFFFVGRSLPPLVCSEEASCHFYHNIVPAPLQATFGSFRATPGTLSVIPETTHTSSHYPSQYVAA